jgi:serine/threonine-protein kinase
MMIGKRISGRYKILDSIGGGGMANVYLAHDMILDRNVAVKMLRLDLTNDEEFIRRFHREAQSATSLTHPHIVNIYDVGEEDNIYYIVMEYVDGQTLKQYIQQYSPLQVEEAIGIMRQLTSAIAHAHQNNIVHRDIKPHNILVDRDGKVKITDFGIAMALSATSITQTNSVLGSVHYLSPEQARGGMANKKSDIYSLGIVFFELLTGRLPFSGESAVSIALKHLQSETPSVRRWNPDIPQSVENIVLKATAKDPFHRYNSVEELDEDLRTAMNPERLHEPKFTVPIDDEATKAIPIITSDRPIQSLDETLVHNTDKHIIKSTDDAKNKSNGKKKRKKWPIILGSILAAVVIISLLIIFALPNLFTKDITIPDVSGLKFDDAVTTLVSKGFVIGETKDLPDDKIEKGKVIKTDPDAGTTAKEGSKINLYTSSGKKKYMLSDYSNRLYNDVVSLLKDEDFKDIKKTEVYDESDPGTIIGQDPPAGEKVTPESTVLTFKVSKGQKKIALKDLTQYSSKAAQDYAQSEGLTFDSSQTQYSDTVPAGMVISQTPAPGTEMQKGDKVSVVISKGVEEKPPKTVTKEVPIPYEPSVPGKLQEVQVYIEDMNHNLTEPAETLYITQDIKKSIELHIEDGKSAEYKIMRDGKVITDEFINYNSVQ